jgi:hypothetical protein
MITLSWETIPSRQNIQSSIPIYPQSPPNTPDVVSSVVGNWNIGWMSRWGMISSRKIDIKHNQPAHKFKFLRVCTLQPHPFFSIDIYLLLLAVLFSKTYLFSYCTVGFICYQLSLFQLYRSSTLKIKLDTLSLSIYIYLRT